jgi:hypothetical protein
LELNEWSIKFGEIYFMAKTSIDPGEFAVFLGSKIPIEAGATAIITRISTKKYKFEISFEFNAEIENTTASSFPIPPNLPASFAIFKSGDCRSSDILLTYVAEALTPSPPDGINLNLKFETTGTKGNHG